MNRAERRYRTFRAKQRKTKTMNRLYRNYLCVCRMCRSSYLVAQQKYKDNRRNFMVEEE